MKIKTEGTIKRYEGKTRVQDFIAIFKNKKLSQIKKFPNGNNSNLLYHGYILPRKIEDLSEVGIDQCSSCECYFPDGLNSCEHCDELFCCDCASEHSMDISTGGCNF